MECVLMAPLMIGSSELLLIILLALLLFGGKKLPEMMRGLGQGVRSFKQGMNESSSSDNEDDHACHETQADESIPSETVPNSDKKKQE